MNVSHLKYALSTLANRHGWLAASPKDQHLTTLLATRDFDTAVGPKTAYLYLIPAGAGCYKLAGEYLSEGRNILSTIGSSCLESSSDDALQFALCTVLSQVDKAVDQSYARRLLLRPSQAK